MYRSGVWYIKQSSNGQPIYYQWGLASDLPVPGDYDADGKTDVAIYRNGDWWIRQTWTNTLSWMNYGLVADMPIQNSFVK